LPLFLQSMLKLYCYIFFIAAVSFLYACGNSASARISTDPKWQNLQLIAASKTIIRSGDIILRSGKDFTSYRIRELSDNDKTYSHAGIAFVQDTNVYIYHITPPDLDEPLSDTAMRMEPLEKFASPSHCFGFGIVRYQLSDSETGAALHYLDSLYKKKVSFDHYFDLEEHQKMYCSEMVDNTLHYASHNRIVLHRKYFTKLQALKAAKYFHSTLDEVNRRAYISIDNLQINPFSTSIHNYVFIK